MPTASSAPAVIAAPPGEGALLRGITFWPATMLVVGNVIGSAIFLTTGGMVEALPSASLALPPSAGVGPLQELARPRGFPFVHRLPVQLAGNLALAIQLLEAL